MSLVEEDSRKLDRTWLCSVLFLDIVNYSSQPVETQVKWKAFFNASLSESLTSVLPSDRIILDTGDGAVVCFLGDPETALLASLSILNQFRAQPDGPAAFVRVGINLGPIRLIRDVNNQMNAVGDGINVGQRIMSFAAGNQLLISRSYYEVISTLSANYKSLFRFDGVRHDKHVREHTVYALVQEQSLQQDGFEGSSDSFERVPSQAPASSIFSPEDLAAIEKKLSHFVGPIARHLVRKAVNQASTLAELCQILAETSIPAAERAKFLNECRVFAGGSTPLNPTIPEVEKIPVIANASPESKEWDNQVLENLRKHLAEYVGPIAGILVTRASKSCRSADELYMSLAQQISSEKERKQFLARRR